MEALNPLILMIPADCLVTSEAGRLVSCSVDVVKHGDSGTSLQNNIAKILIDFYKK